MTEVVIAQRGQKLKMAVILLTFLSVGQRVALHPSGDGLLRRRRQPGPPLRALRAAGDDSGARHWAAEGARHDEPRCLEVRAIQLMSDSIDNVDNVDNVDTALPMLERAAELGNVNAMCIAGVTHFRVCNDRAKARARLLRAEAAGDPDGSRKLIEHGLA